MNTEPIPLPDYTAQWRDAARHAAREPGSHVIAWATHDRHAGALRALRDAFAGRPLRAPHHTCSIAAMLGTASRDETSHVVTVRPGETVLAAGGVLILDEAPEFRIAALAGVADAVAHGSVSLHAGWPITIKAAPTVFAIAPPCPCGYMGSPHKACHCGAGSVARWHGRMDRLIQRLHPMEVTIG